jgi:hypothetical protein
MLRIAMKFIVLLAIAVSAFSASVTVRSMTAGLHASCGLTIETGK